MHAATLLKGNKQAVPTGAALSSAGEKFLYCIEMRRMTQVDTVLVNIQRAKTAASATAAVR